MCMIKTWLLGGHALLELQWFFPVGLTCRCSLGWSLWGSCGPRTSHGMAWDWSKLPGSLQHTQLECRCLHPSIFSQSHYAQSRTPFVCDLFQDTSVSQSSAFQWQTWGGNCLRAGFGSGSHIHHSTGCTLHTRGLLLESSLCMKQTRWQWDQLHPHVTSNWLLYVISCRSWWSYVHWAWFCNRGQRLAAWSRAGAPVDPCMPPRSSHLPLCFITCAVSFLMKKVTSARHVWLLLRACVHPQMEWHRVRCVNKDHALLRKHLLQELEDKWLSKVETLRAAVDYIKHLWSLLDLYVSGMEVSLEDVHNCAAAAEDREQRWWRILTQVGTAI